MATLSPKPPVWASVVCVQLNVFVPEPPSCQQVGVFPEAVSRDGFWSRLMTDWFATVAVTVVDVVELPAVSTARAAKVWLPLATDRESQLIVVGALTWDATVRPSTRKST